MRRLIPVVLCALALSLALPAAAQDATPEATAESTMAAMEPWVCPPGFEGQTLSVYSWSTYVAEDTIPNFEAACGVKVVYDVFGSNEELIARLRTGNPGYDIVVPTDYAVEIMNEEGLLETIDLSKIPNFKNVATYLTNTSFDPNNEHSIPYQWGTVGIGYNRTVVGEDITSWDQMFNYDGNVAWLEDSRVMINTGLIVQGLPPNPTDPAMVETSKQYLVDHGSNVVQIAADDGQAVLQRGDADIVVEYSGDIFQLSQDCQCDDFVYVIPEEGASIWVDNLSIPVDAPNPDLAHAFIDYILDPKVGADISNFTNFGSPNQAAVDLGLINPAAISNPSIYPTEDIASRLYGSVILTPEVEQAINDAWDEIKILLGR